MEQNSSLHRKVNTNIGRKGFVTIGFTVVGTPEELERGWALHMEGAADEHARLTLGTQVDHHEVLKLMNEASQSTTDSCLDKLGVAAELADFGIEDEDRFNVERAVGRTLFGHLQGKRYLDDSRIARQVVSLASRHEPSGPATDFYARYLETPAVAQQG